MDFRQFRKELDAENGRRMTKRDYIVLLILLAVYSVVAFVNLGSVSSPETVWTGEPGTTVIVDLGDTRDVSELRFYGSIAVGDLEIYDESAFINEFFTPGETDPLATFTQDDGDMYKWKELSLETETRYLILQGQRKGFALLSASRLMSCNRHRRFSNLHLVQRKSRTNHQGPTAFRYSWSPLLRCLLR